MSRKKKTQPEPLFAPLDPLWKYPEMMSAQNIAEFAGISENTALDWIRRNGGVLVVKGEKRDTWRIHKSYVRTAFKLPQQIA